MNLDASSLRTGGGVALVLGLLLLGTAYFGSANPLFFGWIPGIELGCVLAGLGAGMLVLARRLGR